VRRAPTPGRVRWPAQAMDGVSAGTLKLSVTPGALCEVTGHARNRVYRADEILQAIEGPVEVRGWGRS